jgi:hypothetical protein
MVSSSNLTCLANASDTKVLIPVSPNQFTVLDGDAEQFTQLTRSQPVRTGNPGLRLQPELRDALCLSYMDVQRLQRVALVRMKEEPEPFISKYDRHSIMLHHSDRQVQAFPLANNA